MTRYALVTLASERDNPEAYMPANYRVLHVEPHPDGRGWRQAVIQGYDVAGWTLDGYVLPRLASGLMHGHEIDLSHEILVRLGDQIRRELLGSGEVEQNAAAAEETWDTEALKRDFEVLGFQAPFVVVRRKSDNATGSLQFTHQPRVYFAWKADQE